MTKKTLLGLLFVALALLIGATVGSQAQDESVNTPAPPPEIEAGAEAVRQAEITLDSVGVSKTVDPSVLDPDAQPWITYVATFTSSLASPVTLDTITDQLPAGFEFWGMKMDSDVVQNPVETQGLLTWTGPFEVPAGGSLQLSYLVWADVGPGTYTNQIQGQSGAVTIGPAWADVLVPGVSLSLSKTASPASLVTGGTVTYDVTISNESAAEEGLIVITDTLPAGYRFVAMDPTSGISQPPSGVEGTIAWTGPYTVPGSGELHLVYQVRTAGVGQAVNQVAGLDARGLALDPAQATVTTEAVRAYLPSILRNYPEYVPPPHLLEEGFTAGVPDEWTPFLNLPGLSASDWFWKGDGTTWGRLDFNAGEALEVWALNMYLGEGAQEWTDYKIEATIRSGKEYRHPLVGIWFRGTYEKRTDKQGGDVGGYLFVFRPDSDYVYLGYIDPATRKLESPKWVASTWYANDTNLWYNVTIQVKGNWIRVWVGDKVVLDWVDPQSRWMKGTVGFAVYRGAGGFDYIKVSNLDE